MVALPVITCLKERKVLKQLILRPGVIFNLIKLTYLVNRVLLRHRL